MDYQTKLIQRRSAFSLALTIGLTLLFFAALLWGLQGATPVCADPGTLHVDGATGSDDSDCSNPADPCATIGYALTQAANGDEILVAAGTYTETLDVFGNPLTLRGGYTRNGTVWSPGGGQTIIDANGADSSVLTIGPGNTVTVESFTIQGANNVSESGGGFVINAATVVISDTLIRDNSTDGSGGGVWIEDSVAAQNHKVSLINSFVVGNSSAVGPGGFAASAWGSMQVTIENTVFSGNTGWSTLGLDNQSFEVIGGQVSSNTLTGPGPAAVDIGSSGTISGTEILSHTGYAMNIGPDGVLSAHNLTIRRNSAGVWNSGRFTVTDSVFENSSGGGEGVIFSENFSETNRLVVNGCTIRGNTIKRVVNITTGYAEFRDTQIVGNVAPAPHTIFNVGEGGTRPRVELVNVLLADNETQGYPTFSTGTGSARLTNLTLAGNDNGNAAVIWAGSAVTATNTIVWGNTTSAEDMLAGPGPLAVTYSDVEGGWTGTGNIDADPHFVDAANGDYHLGVGSPCTDKGTPAGAPLTDIEGTPRDAVPDMGAYEWVGYRVFLPLTLRSYGP